IGNPCHSISGKSPVSRITALIRSRSASLAGTSGARGGPPASPTISIAAFNPGTPRPAVTMCDKGPIRFCSSRPRWWSAAFRVVEIDTSTRRRASDGKDRAHSAHYQRRKQNAAVPYQHVKVLGRAPNGVRDSPHIPRTVLHTNDVLVRRELGDSRGFDHDCSVGRHVVNQNRNG